MRHDPSQARETATAQARSVLAGDENRAPAFIAGQPEISGAWREIRSPFDGRQVGEVAWMDGAAAARAVDAAHQAMTRGGFPAHERAAVLRRAADLAERHAGALAGQLSSEMGKPLRLAMTEVERAVSTLQLSAAEALKLGGEVVPMDATAAGDGHLGFVRRRPVGVVAAITPFNFPLNLAAHKVGPALAAGCAVVLKPADKAPLAALQLVGLLAEAGLPPAWLNALVGDAPEIVDVLANDRRVGLISFTGSSAIGWGLRQRAPRTRVSLELGNATPVIIDETADLARCLGPLAFSAFASAGQSCISVQRIYAEASRLDEVVERLVGESRSLVVGDPSDPKTTVGPLINEPSAERVRQMVSEALGAGGRLAAGGGAHGTMHEPTVVVDVPAGASLTREEVFGPVVCVQPYDDFDQALELANDTRFGLQAGVFTTRIDRAWRAADHLDFAAVLVNEVPTFRADQMPYGGVKDSGNTREGPAYAIREMTEERLLVLRP